jgi:Na+-transporting methylmalonyl-CoA/oxaloacetate decarboxylase gamma subunit
MDQIREIFYWTATIVLMLLGLGLIGFLALLIYFKRLARRLADRSMQELDRVSETVLHATRTWRNLALTRFIIRALKLLI